MKSLNVFMLILLPAVSLASGKSADSDPGRCHPHEQLQAIQQEKLVTLEENNAGGGFTYSPTKAALKYLASSTLMPSANSSFDANLSIVSGSDSAQSATTDYGFLGLSGWVTCKIKSTRILEQTVRFSNETKGHFEGNVKATSGRIAGNLNLVLLSTDGLKIYVACNSEPTTNSTLLSLTVGEYFNALKSIGIESRYSCSPMRNMN